MHVVRSLRTAIRKALWQFVDNPREWSSCQVACIGRADRRSFVAMAAWAGALAISLTSVSAQESIPGADGTVRLSEGRITFRVPAAWQARRPQTRIVEYEFAAPAAEGDSTDARITIMGAGGGVDANIARWIDQFEQPDGSPTKEKTHIEKLQIAGVDVHLVSIRGTYKDRPSGGPFAPGPIVRRPGYRMLGAIIVTPKLGHYYVKMYGPQNTVDAQEQAFREMIKSLSIQMP